MNKRDLIRSIRELTDLADQFIGDKAELLSLACRMQTRVHQLQQQAVAGRPDLAAKLTGVHVERVR